MGCYTTLAPTAVPELWTALAQRHPELELSMREGSGTELAQLVRDGSLDMLIAYEWPFLPTCPGDSCSWRSRWSHSPAATGWRIGS